MDLIIHFIGVSLNIICQQTRKIKFRNLPNITLTHKITLIILRFRRREGRFKRADLLGISLSTLSRSIIIFTK